MPFTPRPSISPPRRSSRSPISDESVWPAWAKDEHSIFRYKNGEIYVWKRGDLHQNELSRIRKQCPCCTKSLLLETLLRADSASHRHKCDWSQALKACTTQQLAWLYGYDPFLILSGGQAGTDFWIYRDARVSSHPTVSPERVSSMKITLKASPNPALKPAQAPTWHYGTSANLNRATTDQLPQGLRGVATASAAMLAGPQGSTPIKGFQHSQPESTQLSQRSLQIAQLQQSAQASPWLYASGQPYRGQNGDLTEEAMLRLPVHCVGCNAPGTFQDFCGHRHVCDRLSVEYKQPVPFRLAQCFGYRWFQIKYGQQGQLQNMFRPIPPVAAPQSQSQPGKQEQPGNWQQYGSSHAESSRSGGNGGY